MYYEISGSGRPLILLHGSYMSIDLNFGQIIPQLNKNHRVIALELQGHGRTADINRPYSFSSMGDDVAALIKYLKIDSAEPWSQLAFFPGCTHVSLMMHTEWLVAMLPPFLN